MKFNSVLLLAGLLVGLASPLAHANLKGAPYMPELDARLDAIEGSLQGSADSADGSFMPQRYTRATYDVAVDGVSSSTPVGLGVYLPAKAIVTKVLYYIDTQFVDSGVGSIALQCEDGNNLIAQTDITSFAVGAVKLGVPVETTPTVVDNIAAQCEVKAVASNCANCVLPSVGKFTADIEYYIKN